MDSKEINVTLKSSLGKLSLKVDTKITITELLVKASENMNVEHEAVIYNKRKIDTGKTLADYNIQDGDTLEISSPLMN